MTTNYRYLIHVSSVENRTSILKRGLVPKKIIDSDQFSKDIKNDLNDSIWGGYGGKSLIFAVPLGNSVDAYDIMEIRHWVFPVPMIYRGLSVDEEEDLLDQAKENIDFYRKIQWIDDAEQAMDLEMRLNKELEKLVKKRSHNFDVYLIDNNIANCKWEIDKHGFNEDDEREAYMTEMPIPVKALELIAPANRKMRVQSSLVEERGYTKLEEEIPCTWVTKDFGFWGISTIVGFTDQKLAMKDRQGNVKLVYKSDFRRNGKYAKLLYYGHAKNYDAVLALKPDSLIDVNQFSREYTLQEHTKPMKRRAVKNFDEFLAEASLDEMSLYGYEHESKEVMEELREESDTFEEFLKGVCKIHAIDLSKLTKHDIESYRKYFAKKKEVAMAESNDPKKECPYCHGHSTPAKLTYSDKKCKGCGKYVSEMDPAAIKEVEETMPDGAFPIRNTHDLRNAVKAIGRAKDYEKAKAWIVKRAQALKATDLLPKDWYIQPTEPR
jgi:hypothetical protein